MEKNSVAATQNGWEKLKQRNQELENLNVQKNKFFFIIAHDLRGPFNSFLGLTELMAEDAATMSRAEMQAMAVNMYDVAANMFRLLENLLRWAEIQQGLAPFAPQPVRLRAAVEEGLALAAGPAKSKAIEINCTVPDEMEVFVDCNMFQTVLRNLVSNAIKFTGAGGKVHLTAKPSGQTQVELSVTDSGIGMSRAMTDNLFRLDMKINRPGTANEPGTGLGLLLCKDFVEKCGGRIWVESEENKGSAFYFTVPRSAHPARRQPFQCQ